MDYFSTMMAGAFRRRLVIMRHAERVDFTFGAWIPSSFDDKGNYIKKNLNMPISVPKRSGGPMDFFKDSPLTRIGLFQATLTGEAMHGCDMTFDYVFCSPSLRCIETCTNVLRASDQADVSINIEPGLFEWCQWYRNGMPKWMSYPELRECGFNINPNYKPVINEVDLNTSESSEEYYMRSFLVSSKLLEAYTGDLLFVGHAATLDTCSRQLTGRSPRNDKDLQNLVMKVPYASVSVVVEKNDRSWHLEEPPFPPIRHCDNLSFDWHILLS